jgi:hypothetical protein
MKKTIGRPPGRTYNRTFQMRVSDDFLKLLDAWRKRHPDRPSRTEAIRELVEYAIEHQPKSKR